MSAPQTPEGWQMEIAKVEYWTAIEKQRPSTIYKPRLSVDGNQWCASYGDMPDGVHGFGDSPVEAMLDFDKEWNKKLTAPQSEGIKDVE
jgi:hypothetical protein